MKGVKGKCESVINERQRFTLRKNLQNKVEGKSQQMEKDNKRKTCKIKKVI